MVSKADLVLALMKLTPQERADLGGRNYINSVQLKHDMSTIKDGGEGHQESFLWKEMAELRVVGWVRIN